MVVFYSRRFILSITFLVFNRNKWYICALNLKIMKKNRVNLFLIAALMLGSFAYTGCGKKGCTVEADDNFDALATESDPEACDPTGTVSKFVGSYSGVETCTSGNDSYTLSITASANEYTVLLGNVYDAGTGFVISAEVNQNTITITNQTVQGVAVTGSGTLSGNILTVNYTLSVAGDSDACVLTATKQ